MVTIYDTETVIAADLDGTLAESKVKLSPEMATVISKWLCHNRFAIISGAKQDQFQSQVVSALPEGTYLENLFLFPTDGAACYIYQNSVWTRLYENTISTEESDTIKKAIESAVEQSGLTFDELFGEQIEYRGGQVTFSALGQQAPLSKKTPWDPDQSKRKIIVSFLSSLLHGFEVSIAGATSIDVTRKGTDKAYAISKIKEILKTDNEHIIFFGDAMFEGGNDHSVIATGVTTVKVSGPDDTEKKIKYLIEAVQ